MTNELVQQATDNFDTFQEENFHDLPQHLEQITKTKPQRSASRIHRERVRALVGGLEDIRKAGPGKGDDSLTTTQEERQHGDKVRTTGEVDDKKVARVTVRPTDDTQAKDNHDRYEHSQEKFGVSTTVVDSVRNGDRRFYSVKSQRIWPFPLRLGRVSAH